MSENWESTTERATASVLSGAIDNGVDTLATATPGCAQCYAKRRMVTVMLLQAAENQEMEAACQEVEADEHARMHRYSQAEHCARIATMNRGFAAQLRNIAAL